MAKLINPFDQDTQPPFDGFPRDTMRFLKELKENNDRDWFAEHKQRYEQSVKVPMLSLLATLAARMKGVDARIVLEPKKALYRIYRDVRFSKDKSPYKTWIAAAFTFEGYDRKHDSAFYFHISTDEIGVGGGLYNPMGDRLKNLRKAIGEDARPLRKILAAKAFKQEFSEMTGEELQRVPQGFEKDHPDADLLKKKQFLCWKTLPKSRVTKPEFTDDLVAAFKAMAPFVRYLAEHS